MKKEYSSPDILFESFSLSENIASGNSNCTRNVSNQYSGTCGLHYGNKVIFTMSASGCRVQIEDGSTVFDGLCYHVPTGDNKLFNS